MFKQGTTVSVTPNPFLPAGYGASTLYGSVKKVNRLGNADLLIAGRVLYNKIVNTDFTVISFDGI